ncbi:MAG: HEPN domain-containing protein [Bacteroidetes bacterium]|nr:HEPN domain-containing protein [Bacteroidota bacterium]
MNIKVIDHALEDIQDFSGNSRIKDLLTQALLILICAQFEKEIENCLTRRCASVSDEAIKGFIDDYIQGSALRSLKISNLSGLLKKFDPSYKKMFTEKINQNGQAKVTYDSILTNRNSVAHGEGTNATFEEVKMYYEQGHIILDYFEQALRVN